MSAAITGCYKYPDRGSFLQQTPDAVEEQRNGYEYGVGDYKDDDPDAARARLTQNVEGLRNEQRRRQQQLDQPTPVASHRTEHVCVSRALVRGPSTTVRGACDMREPGTPTCPGSADNKAPRSGLEPYCAV
ncbi:hypothetical protein [Streptomyces rochei]|uniref:hypothetical protein n=1 Tax=Streptomyces rochei TaxID=1928 RepID=UPI0033BBA657